LIPFLFVAEMATNKNKALLPNRRLTIGQKFFPLHTWRLGAKIFVEVVLFNVMLVRI
jgi:hypothetical protein